LRISVRADLCVHKAKVKKLEISPIGIGHTRVERPDSFAKHSAPESGGLKT